LLSTDWEPQFQDPKLLVLAWEHKLLFIVPGGLPLLTLAVMLVVDMLFLFSTSSIGVVLFLILLPHVDGCVDEGPVFDFPYFGAIKTGINHQAKVNYII